MNSRALAAYRVAGRSNAAPPTELALIIIAADVVAAIDAFLVAANKLETLNGSTNRFELDGVASVAITVERGLVVVADLRTTH